MTTPQQIDDQRRVRAFEVIVKHWTPKHSGIYAATTRNAATYKAWAAAHDAGYDSVKFGDLRTVRAPEFDAIVSELKHGVNREWACLLLQKAKGLAQ